MKKFVAPEMEVEKFNIEDVITTSDLPPADENDLGWN